MSETTTGLIVINNDVPMLAPEISKRIVDFETTIKELEKQRDDLKKAILQGMEECGVLKFDNDLITVNYIAPCDAETFDKAKFKKEHPDLHDEYITMKPRSAYIKIAVKKEK